MIWHDLAITSLDLHFLYNMEIGMVELMLEKAASKSKNPFLIKNNKYMQMAKFLLLIS